ncbi:MAG: glycoside hydrolase family 20 zincin-like fold domain-containing protein [Verrucomicrobiota bacterium]
MRVAHILFSGLFFLSSWVVAGDEFDTLIPYPRELKAVGDAVAIEGFQIIAGPSLQAKIGAEEINQRVRLLGGKELRVSPIGEVLPEGDLIIIATSGVSEVAAIMGGMPGGKVAGKKLGPQGYVIRAEKGDDGSTRLWLVGSDKQGTLYAAVSVRQFIQGTGNDEIMIRPVEITDWPDFKKRQVGYPMSEPRRGLWYTLKQLDGQGKTIEAEEVAKRWVARKKKHYDWMLRAKINWAWSHSFLKAGQFGENTRITRAALKEIHDYGVQRGIRTMVSGTTSVGSFPADKDNPDFKGVAYHSSHHRYFCWSRLKYHEEKARRTARMVAESGYKGYYLHAADGGGWRNPGLWNDRCDLCKKTYGDDHAKADAVVFGIYYREIRKLVPDCEFVTVVYPYSPEQLDPDLVYKDASAEMGPGPEAKREAQERTQKLADFVKRLDQLLPEDIFVTIRESERTPFDRMRATWGKRRFHTYFEYAFWKGWQPYFTTSPLWTRSMYYPDYDDMFFGNMSGLGWREFTELLGAECAWNVNRPGAKDFSESGWKDLGTRLEPPAERKVFASRAARFWFGPKMGGLIAPAFGENISHAFIAFPGKILERADFDNPLALMQGQVQATRRAALSLDKARTLQQSQSILAGEDLGFFLNMYLMTHGAHFTAAHRARVLEIEQAIKRGDREKCEQILLQSQKDLKLAAVSWQKVSDGVVKKDLMYHYTRKRTNPHSYLSNLDFAEFEKELELLAGSYEQKITERSMPSWFLRELPRRRLNFVRRSDEIVIDGKLAEATWAAAQPASNFISNDRLQLEARETQVRLAYDDKNIYVSFECHNADGKDRVTFAVAANKKAPIEGKAGESWQWVAGQSGMQTATHYKAAPYHAIVGGKKVDGQVVIDENWRSKMKVQTAMVGKVWTVEMAIPIEELGFNIRAGRSCVSQLSRQSGGGRVSFSYLEGGEVAGLQHFTLAEFSTEEKTLTAVQVGLKIAGLELRHETIGSGAGTVIKGDLSLLCDRPLHDVEIEVTASDGRRSLGELSFPNQATLPLIWRPDKDFVMRFAEELPGVVGRFKITAKEGEWEFTRRFGSPRRSQELPQGLYTEGVGEGAALNGPVHFPSVGPTTTPWAEGTIEFWLKPGWQSQPRLEGPRGTLEHALVHMGPIRPDHPTLSNVNSLALIHSSTGHLSASLTSSRYRHRAASANIRSWKAGQWHHLAMQWKLDDGGRTTVQIYLDGKLSSAETYATPKDTAAEPLQPSNFRPPIQIGSMNTGVRPADAAIDELRISSVRRYREDFVPSERFSADDKTLALFHFDKQLEAEVPGGLSATVGAAQ